MSRIIAGIQPLVKVDKAALLKIAITVFASSLLGTIFGVLACQQF